MPGLGLHMRLAPRLEQRLALQLRPVLAPRDLGVDPFRTNEESAQISQYEVLSELEGILRSGEFFDAYHFSLEINRSAFAKSLKAVLTTFARDLSGLVKGYACDEALAKRMIQILSKTEKQDQEKKDALGKIVGAWNASMCSPYFPDESRHRSLLAIASMLQDRSCDLAAGFSLVSQAARLDGQPALVQGTLKKLEEYSLSDTRIIPFAQEAMIPLIRAVSQKSTTSKIPVTPEETMGLYERIVESIYMLDRQSHVHDTLERIRESANNLGIAGVLSWPIPVPIMAYLVSANVSRQCLDRAVNLCLQTEFVQGREVQRNTYKGLASMQECEQSKEVLSHIIDHAQTAKGLARILSAVNLVHVDPEFKYPFDLTKEDDILRNLRLQLTDKSIKRLELSDAVLEKYIARLESDDRFASVGKIITTLAGYSHYQDESQISLLREIVEQELNGGFVKWRYSHDLAKEQLGVLNGKTQSWQQNARVTRLVGELHALLSHIEAVKHLLPEMEESYQAHYSQPVAKISVKELQDELSGLEDSLRKDVPAKEKKSMGARAALLRERIAYTGLLASITDLTIESYPDVLTKAQTLARKKTSHPLYEAIKWVSETLDQPDYREARKIDVYETDDLEALLRFGEVPVPHCQNWKNNSSLNKSLLSFVADANKKLYIISSRGRPISMSMERLIEVDGAPALLIENVYENEWSDDYGIALVGSVLDKAALMYEETGKPITIASNCEKITRALEHFSKKYNVGVFEETIHINPPKSKNPWEYWDCVQYHTGYALQESGRGVSVRLKYVVIGSEDDGE